MRSVRKYPSIGGPLDGEYPLTCELCHAEGVVPVRTTQNTPQIGPKSITVNVCPDCNKLLRYSPSWCDKTGQRHTCPDTARPVKYVRADLVRSDNA